MHELHFEDFFASKSVKVYLESIKTIYICIGFKFFNQIQNRFITIIHSYLEQERKRKGEKGQEKKEGQKRNS